MVSLSECVPEDELVEMFARFLSIHSTASMLISVADAYPKQKCGICRETEQEEVQ
jgi:hypothetical protein